MRPTPASSGPCEACTADIESSTVTRCIRPPVQVASRCGPAPGRISASRPVTTCERLSLVETCTVRSALRIACSVTSVSGAAETKLPPIAKKTLALPSRSASIASTVSRPCSRGGSKPNSSLQRVEEVLGRAAPRCPWSGRPARWSGRAPGRARRRACRCCPAERDVDDLLDRRDRVAVLGDAPSPSRSRCASESWNIRAAASICGAVEPGRAPYGVPVELAHVRGPLLEAGGVLARRSRGRRASHSSSSDADRLEEREVAVDPDRQVQVGEARCRGRPRRAAFCGFLKRTSPASRSGLTEMILAPFCLAISSAVSIRGWLVPGFWPAITISSASWMSSRRDRALADADRLGQRRPTSTRGTCWSSRAGCWCRSARAKSW